MNLDNISTKFFLIQDLLMFLQTSVKDFRSRVTNLIFIGPSQNECVLRLLRALLNVRYALRNLSRNGT